ncbi:MAG TPA: O-antigen ligase family protein [Chloroflexota bacterium]
MSRLTAPIAALGDTLPPLTRHTLTLAGLAVLIGGIMAALPPMLGAALLAAAVIVPLALARPLFALCLPIVIIPLSSEYTLGLGGLNLTLMEPAVGLAVVAWLLAGARQRTLRIWPSALLAAQLLVFALFVVSALGAEAPGPSLKDTLKWLELVVVFVLTVGQARRASQARWLLLALVGTASLEACYGLFQFVTRRGPDFFVIGPFLRAYGHFAQPNPFAGYLATAFPLAFALAVWSKDEEPGPGRLMALGPRRLSASVAGWAWPATILLAAGILASMSRGAWMGVGLALAVMLAVASPHSRRWLAVVVAGLLLLGLLGLAGALPPFIGERLGVVAEYFGLFDVRTVDLTSENWSIVERMAHWQAAWYMFLEHPWFGIGPGNYGTLYDQYYLPGWLEPLGHAHNYYLNLAAETGVVGLSGFLLTLGLAFRATIHGLRGPNPFWRAVGLGVLGSLVAICLHSAFDDLLVHGVSVQIGALMGLAALASGQAEADRG